MKKFVMMTAALTAIFSSPTLAWAQQATTYPGSHMMWDGGWQGWFLGPLMMIAFLTIAVAAVVLVIRWLGGDRDHRVPTQTHREKKPMDILRIRFAKGEIDNEEFEERRKILEG